MLQSSLRSERLELRPMATGDFELFVDLATDPEVMRYVRAPDTRAQCERVFAECLELAQRATGHGFWVVRERPRAEEWGWIFLKPMLDGYLANEFGYRYRQESWGRGIASEAAVLLAKHALEELHFDHLVAITHPENVASQRVLTKAGLIMQAGRYRFYGKEVCLFGTNGIPGVLRERKD